MVYSGFLSVICGKKAKNILFLLFILGSIPVFAQQKNGDKAIAADTFKLADKLLAKKKFRKAAKLYDAYYQHHPTDMNAAWKLAQTHFWLHNFKKADTFYKTALKLAPSNDYLRLNYIHSLMDMGKASQASDMLTEMELSGKDYSDMSALRSRLSFYQGDYREAAAYMRKSLSIETNNAEANDLNDQIAIARAPVVSLNSSYVTDNQPYTAVISTLKAENYFSKYADLYIIADEYHFMNNVTSDAPWVKIGDKLFFPKAGLRLNVGGGVFKYPVKNDIGWSANLALNKKISNQFDIDVTADHMPYFDTKTSVDTTVSMTKVAAMLNWHLRNWSAQVAVLNSNFDSTNVYGTYGWVLAPIVSTDHVQLLVGASAGYSNSTANTYTSTESVPYAEAHFASNPNINGIYDPYFTPNKQFTTSGLLALNLFPSKVVSINLSGDIGYGSIDAPYLFLNKHSNDTIFIDKGYATQNFTPIDAKAVINFNVGKNWQISARYIFTNTYFFTSNYVGVGISKSFVPRKKRAGEGTSSTFSRLMDEIEGELQALYRSSDADGLKSSVGEIRGKLVKLRDAQKNKARTTETLQGSEESMTLQERYESLNEMIEELDSVDLNDYKESGKSKKEWLVDKLFELTSITYNGSRD